MDRRGTSASIRARELLMSVLMTLRVSGNPKAIEATDPDLMKTVAARGREYGVIRHRFYGSEDEVLVVDEWPDEASFQAFFDASPEIKEFMDAAGVTAAPQIDFWRPLDVDDAID
jgi:quinol monooxygenase YgiN